MKTIINMLLVTGVAVIAGCGGGDSTGVCVSSPAIFGNTYCYSNFTKAECDDYDAQDVNGGSPWFFHSGQTCSDRGLNEGSN